MNKPRYIYDICGDIWYVYEMTYYDKGSSGTKVSEAYFNREDARKETYRLNGWKYTEPNK